MIQFVVRAAQSAFNEAGISRDEGYRKAQQIAEVMYANLNACKQVYSTDDELELARRMARSAVAGTLRNELYGPIHNVALAG